MTARLKKRDNSFMILSDREVEDLTPMLNDPNVRFLTIQGKTIRKDLIDDIEPVHNITCTKCGEAFLESTPHYCTYKGLNAVIDNRGKHSPNLEKLREQVRLVKSGVSAREAYRQAWGKELPNIGLSLSDQRDITNGQAKLLYTEDGVAYVGYDITAVNADYARQRSSWASFQSQVRDGA